MAVRRTRKVKEAVKKTICHGCGYKVEYTLNDVKRYSGTDYGGGPDGREWIVCECGHDITLRSW